MTYGQIITLLFILLILYYAGLVTMDIMADKRMKASDEAKTKKPRSTYPDLRAVLNLLRSIATIPYHDSTAEYGCGQV